RLRGRLRGDRGGAQGGRGRRGGGQRRGEAPGGQRLEARPAGARGSRRGGAGVPERGGAPGLAVRGRRAMSEVTEVLRAIEQGDPHAASQLLPLVYQELRRLAALKLAREG